MAETTAEHWTAGRIIRAQEFMGSYVRAGEKVFRAGVVCASVEDFRLWAKSAATEHDIVYHPKVCGATLERRGFIMFFPVFEPSIRTMFKLSAGTTAKFQILPKKVLVAQVLNMEVLTASLAGRLLFEDQFRTLDEIVSMADTKWQDLFPNPRFPRTT